MARTATAKLIGVEKLDEKTGTFSQTILITIKDDKGLVKSEVSKIKFSATDGFNAKQEKATALANALLKEKYA